MRKHMILAAIAATALTVPAFGDLVAYDPFLSGDNRGAGEYTAGNDMRTMGAAALGWAGGPPDGFGVSHAGSTGNFIANAVGEDSPAVDYEGGGRMQWLGVGNFPFDRNLTRQLNPIPASSEYYMSIMVNRLGWAGAPADNTYVVGGFTDAAGNGLQVGYSDEAGDGVPDLVLRAGGVNNVLLADAPSSANQFVFITLGINESGNDTIEVIVDPDTLTAATAADVTLTGINVSDSLSPFTQSKYESPGQSGVVFFDEIRLGTDFESVSGIIPEPASLGLLGMAGLGLIRRRKA